MNNQKIVNKIISDIFDNWNNPDKIYEILDGINQNGLTATNFVVILSCLSHSSILVRDMAVKCLEIKEGIKVLDSLKMLLEREIDKELKDYLEDVIEYIITTNNF